MVAEERDAAHGRELAEVRQLPDELVVDALVEVEGGEAIVAQDDQSTEHDRPRDGQHDEHRVGELVRRPPRSRRFVCRVGVGHPRTLRRGRCDHRRPTGRAGSGEHYRVPGPPPATSRTRHEPRRSRTPNQRPTARYRRHDARRRRARSTCGARRVRARRPRRARPRPRPGRPPGGGTVDRRRVGHERQDHDHQPAGRRDARRGSGHDQRRRLQPANRDRLCPRPGPHRRPGGARGRRGHPGHPRRRPPAPVVVLGNLSRDQLDRYGEVRIVAARLARHVGPPCGGRRHGRRRRERRRPARGLGRTRDADGDLGRGRRRVDRGRGHLPRVLGDGRPR